MKPMASSLSPGVFQVGTLFNVGKGTNFFWKQNQGVGGEYVGSWSALTEQILTKRQNGGIDLLGRFKII